MRTLDFIDVGPCRVPLTPRLNDAHIAFRDTSTLLCTHLLRLSLIACVCDKGCIAMVRAYDGSRQCMTHSPCPRPFVRKRTSDKNIYIYIYMYFIVY